VAGGGRDSGMIREGMNARPSRAILIVAAALTCSAWPAAFVLWFRLGERAFAVSAFLLGLSLGPLLAAWAFAPRKSRQAFRKLVLVTGGLSILAFPLLGAVNLDLEGFFMLLLLGSGGVAAGHTMVTVIAGPLIFGRVLCGWGCWRAMILELLPTGRSPGRRDRAWRLLPYGGLALSIGAAAMAVFALGEQPGGRPGKMHGASLTGCVAAIAVYYAASIGLAFALRDRRAFCKYLCPSGAILRLTSRPSIFKMTPAAGRCDGCGACTRVCPMDIDVAGFAARGRRIASGECILCQRCAEVCPSGALRLAAGLDCRGADDFR